MFGRGLGEGGKEQTVWNALLKSFHFGRKGLDAGRASLWICLSLQLRGSALLFGMSPSPLVCFTNLSTGFSRGGKVRVVGRELCGSLHTGSLVALIGSNGVGKSTLLRTLAGLQSALSGNLLWAGQPIRSLSSGELARMVSVVLTFRPAIDALTAGEVVEAGRIPHTSRFGGLSREDRAKVDEALELTGASDFRNRPVLALSDGERQRVFLAKALAQETPAILLDEPTAFLDFPSKIQIFSLLGHLAHMREKAVLVSTHDVEAALHFADELWMLTPAGLSAGSPWALAHDGTLGALFDAAGVRFDAEEMRFVYDGSHAHARAYK